MNQLREQDGYSDKTLKDLNELWYQLWDKTKSEYKSLEPMNLPQIQQHLEEGELFLALCEGHSQLGAVVVASDRAFVSYLGTKRAFAGSLDRLVEQQALHVRRQRLLRRVRRSKPREADDHRSCGTQWPASDTPALARAADKVGLVHVAHSQTFRSISGCRLVFTLKI